MNKSMVPATAYPPLGSHRIPPLRLRVCGTQHAADSLVRSVAFPKLASVYQHFGGERITRTNGRLCAQFSLVSHDPA